MYIDFLSKILENIWCNIYNMIRICYSSHGPGRLLFPLYILTKQDIILRTLTNNFWLFDNKFLGTWKVTENKKCCKFLLHFSGKCASNYMHFRWNSIGKKHLNWTRLKLILWKLHTEGFFISFSFFLHQICIWNVNVHFTWNSCEAQFAG